MDIQRSMNSRDSLPRRKFKNRAQTRCSPGPILWPPTISFELHAKTAEDIDLEKCNFRNFGSSVTFILGSGRGRPTHQIRLKSEKLFEDIRTDRPDFQSSRSSPGDDLKIQKIHHSTTVNSYTPESLLGGSDGCDSLSVNDSFSSSQLASCITQCQTVSQLHSVQQSFTLHDHRQLRFNWRLAGWVHVSPLHCTKCLHCYCTEDTKHNTTKQFMQQ